ncbi:MAG: hypothetical protein SGI92_09915 [Bryobacteraceae bacterium]|nr:hypothetical protein [Bryobacteraceae bacterium]
MIRRRLCALVTLTSLTLLGADLVPLALELPKPMFEGTPQNLQVPNLEKPRKGPRAPFLAPADTVNLAKGRRVTGPGSDPVTGELSFLTDGEKSGGDGSWVELAPGPQYVTIDLKKKSTIYALLVWHYHKQPRVYKGVVVQTADDPDFITGVRTIFNNDVDNSVGAGVGKDQNYIETSEGRLIDARGVEARYVRLYSNGNNINGSNHYVEVEVFGKPLN